MEPFALLFIAISASGNRLCVHFEAPEVIDGKLLPGAFVVVEDGDDSALCGRFGKPTNGTPHRVFWTCDGYDTAPPAWAADGEALLRALVDGDELTGWDRVQAGDL